MGVVAGRAVLRGMFDLVDAGKEHVHQQNAMLAAGMESLRHSG